VARRNTVLPVAGGSIARPGVLRRETDALHSQIVSKKPYLGKPADVFCLGEITYTLLSGVNPFWAAPPHKLDDYIKAGKWTFYERSFAKVSAEAKDFICKCLETDPAKRMTAEEALDHPWITKYCPKPYLDWLKAINVDLMEYEKLGLEEESRHFVESIKDHANDGEWTLGHAVSDDALPERPWRRGTTPPPPDGSGLAISGTPIAKPGGLPGAPLVKPAQVLLLAPDAPTEAEVPLAAPKPSRTPPSPILLTPAEPIVTVPTPTPEHAEQEEEPRKASPESSDEYQSQITIKKLTGEIHVPMTVTIGRRTSKATATFTDDDGTEKIIGVLSLSNDVERVSLKDEPTSPTSPTSMASPTAEAKMSIRSRKSSNMLFKGQEVGVLEVGSVGDLLDGGNDEMNLMTDLMGNLQTASRKGSSSK